MSDGMTKKQYIERVKNCAEILRKISDSEVLGDGTRESWACGISSNLLADLIEYKEREEAPKHLNIETIVSAIKEVAAAISENDGADIKAIFEESEGELLAHIIVEPYCFISKADNFEREGRE